MAPFRNVAASLVLAGGLLLCSTSARAQEAFLTAPAGGVPMEAAGQIVLQVAESVSDARYSNFFVQLDGDDITSLVSVTGRTVTYQPPVKLAPGDHILLLVEKKGEGQFVEVARWALRVGDGGASGTGTGPAGVAGAGGEAAPAVTGEFAGQYNYLVSDNLEHDDKVRPHSGTATMNVGAHVSSGHWDTTAKLNGYYDSKERNNAPDDDHFMLGEYLVTAQGKYDLLTATLNLGNHDAGISNLLVDQYYRRGISARLDVSHWLRATAFAQDPARAIGNSNVTGIARDEQRGQGGALRLFPLPGSYGERVWVEGATYYSEGTIAGDGAGVPANFSNLGRGWAGAAEAQTLDDKVNLRGDFSQTQFDDDGRAAALKYVRDEAYRGRVAWSPIATLLQTDTSAERLQFVGQYQHYGTFYRSLANLGAPIDEERLSVSGSYLKDSLSVSAETYFAQNNVNDEPLLPTDRGMGALFNVSVQPVFFWGDIDASSLFGRTTWNMGASVARELRHETPAGFLGDGLNQHTLTANGGWTVAFDKVNGTLSHTFTDFDNQAVPIDSYQTHFTELSMTWQVNDRFTVTPAAQMQIQQESGPDPVTKQYFASIDTSAIIIPDKLSHTFHYGAILDNGTAADDQHNLLTEFVWQVNQASLNHPGVAVSLSGAYDHATRDALPPGSDKDEIYKVFLSLKVASPFGF